MAKKICQKTENDNLFLTQNKNYDNREVKTVGCLNGLTTQR